MRKWIALGLAACMTVSSLTGCGSSKKEAETTAAESAAEVLRRKQAQKQMPQRARQRKAKRQDLIWTSWYLLM